METRNHSRREGYRRIRLLDRCTRAPVSPCSQPREPL